MHCNRATLRLHGHEPIDVTGANMCTTIDTKVYTTSLGHAVIEQASGSVVLSSAEQILAVIRQLHTCYDYCASWKQSPDIAPADGSGA
jgi:hypothetical protein